MQQTRAHIGLTLGTAAGCRLVGLHLQLPVGRWQGPAQVARTPQRLAESRYGSAPYFASDKILACFPRTMLWVSASDPLLDDSVDFNTRLRRVGTESCVHAAQHMPHAFWGLANAGFPEAIKVQNSCKAFLREAILDCHRTLPSNTY